MKRLLNCHASDFKQMDGKELKQAVLASEGRTVLGETIVTAEPLLKGLTNVEVLASFGADLIVLNEYDTLKPVVKGLDTNAPPIQTLKNMVGLPIGINLEPVDSNTKMLEDTLEISAGRQATKETFMEADKQKVDFICITGNPATGVSNASIEKAIVLARRYFNGLIFAGKMHSSGVDESVLNLDSVLSFIEKGADGILLPAPGTIPGVLEIDLYNIVKEIKKRGALGISTIGTSQESADLDTIKQLALSSKRAGVDVQHIGDGSFSSVAVPENIMTLSIAIRGKRHTYYRMAQSLTR